MEKIVNKNDKRIELLVGKFFQSGFNIWTTQQLSETYLIDVNWSKYFSGSNILESVFAVSYHFKLG